jgi:pyruvate dehydrogenase complex dehydrogenase (E1) component
VPLGVETFGQTGDLPDLYEHFMIDSAAIVAAYGRLKRN